MLFFPDGDVPSADAAAAGATDGTSRPSVDAAAFRATVAGGHGIAALLQEHEFVNMMIHYTPRDTPGVSLVVGKGGLLFATGARAGGGAL